MDVLAAAAGLPSTPDVTLTVVAGSVIASTSFPFGSSATANAAKASMASNLPDQAALQDALTSAGVAIVVLSEAEAEVTSTGLDDGDHSLSSESTSAGGVVGGAVGGTAGALCLLMLYLKLRKRKTPLSQQPTVGWSIIQPTVGCSTPAHHVSTTQTTVHHTGWGPVPSHAHRDTRKPQAAQAASVMLNDFAASASAAPSAAASSHAPGSTSGQSNTATTQMTFKEMVEMLKRELGVSGSHREVVYSSAKQLGLWHNNPGIEYMPLTDLAKMCIQALGTAESPSPQRLPPPRVSPRTQGMMERDGFALRLLQSGLINDKPVLAGLQKLLQTADKAYLGKGKDVQKIYGPYDNLKLACAWRIDHPARREMYDAAVKKVKEELVRLKAKGKDTGSPPGLPARTTSTAEDKRRFELNAESNEALLLHGTGPDRLLSLLAQGPNERFAGGNAGTMFGDGIYLAEDIGKADQYVAADTSYDTKSELHERLYAPWGGQSRHPKHVFYVLVCRTALGYPVRTDKGRGRDLVSMDDRHQKIFPENFRELSPVAGVVPPIFHHSLIVELGNAVKRYREFLTFHSEYVYAEYLVAYQRYNADQLLRTDTVRT